MVPPRLDMVAYHEAGHAVVAGMLGLKIVHVNILDGAEGALTESANSLARDLDKETYLAAISKDIIVALAGPHAQHRRHPPPAKRQPAEWEDDIRVATSLAFSAALVASGVERDQIDLAMLNNPTPSSKPTRTTSSGNATTERVNSLSTTGRSSTRSHKRC